MAYPTGTDLGAFLIARGVLSALPASLDDLNDIMEALCLQFEQDTGFVPFLAAVTPAIRPYTMNGENILFLNAGITGDPTTDMTIAIDGSAQTIVNHFVMEPANAVSLGRPYTQVHFNYNVVSEPHGVVITAQFGFTETLAANIIRGLLQGGAAEYLRDISNTIVSTSGQVIEFKQDDVQKKFANVNSALTGAYVGSLQQQFGSAYARIVRTYLAPWKVLA